MRCDCNNIGFSFRKLEPDGNNFQLVEITCCNTLPIDGKKKKPCNFYNKTIIRKDIIIEYKPANNENIGDIFHNRTPEENCRKEINDYINLCKIALCYKNIDNSRYISMINHNLRLLQYKLYNQETESLDELINRLKYPPDNICINKINMLPYKKYKKRKKRNNITKLLYKTEDNATNDSSQLFIEYNEKIYYDEDDNSSENDVLSEDNTIVDGEFDIDNYDSVDEDIDIEEAFSD